MRLTKGQIQNAERFVRRRLDNLNWVHTQKVRKIAKKLAKLEKANLNIVDIAALFHDVAKNIADDKSHSKIGSEITERYLKKNGFGNNFIESVAHCVKVHSAPWKNKSKQVDTIEARVVFDSDMIQQISPLGIAKHFHIFDNKGFRDCVKYSKESLFKAYKYIITKNGKEIAKRRITYIKEFFRDLKI